MTRAAYVCVLIQMTAYVKEGDCSPVFGAKIAVKLSLSAQARTAGAENSRFRLALDDHERDVVSSLGSLREFS